ncbi:MAG TPA: hypothetical protein VFZ48_05800 [Candidatus Saccharimonadales bacterium]
MFSHLKNNYISTSIGYSFLLGTGIWIVTFLQVALQLRNTVDRVAMVTFGPLELASVTKVNTQDGTIVTIGLEQHLFLYFALWVTGGLLVGMVLSYSKKRAALPPDTQPKK